MNFNFVCKRFPRGPENFVGFSSKATGTTQGGAVTQLCFSALAMSDSSIAIHPSIASWMALACGGETELYKAKGEDVRLVGIKSWQMQGAPPQLKSTLEWLLITDCAPEGTRSSMAVQCYIK